MPQIFAKGLRNPGVLVSGAQALGTGPVGKKYAVLCLIDQVDLDDPTVHFAIDMQIQNSDGTWPANANAGVAFDGGPNQGKGGTATPVPGWTQDGDPIANKSVRFRLTNTGRAVNLGLTADPV